MANSAAAGVQPRPSRRFRRRATLGLALSAGLLPLAAIPFLPASEHDAASPVGVSTADAATTCILPKVADVNPAAVPPCSTIQPSTTKPPPPPDWSANIGLDAEGPFAQPLTATRSYIDPSTNPPTVTAAGSTSVTLTTGLGLGLGSVAFNGQPQPNGTQFALRLQEPGVAGPLCRIEPTGNVPTGGKISSLVGPAVVETADDLQSLASTLTGIEPLPGLGTFTVTAAQLTPNAKGLMLGAQGTVVIPDPNKPGVTYTFNATYSLNLVLSPSTDPNVLKVVGVTDPDPGTMAFTWAQNPLPPNPDVTLRFLQTAAQKNLQFFTPIIAEQKVNDTFNGMHDVRWFTTQGFSPSVRSVTASTTGLSVVPTFCRWDPHSREPDVTAGGSSSRRTSSGRAAGTGSAFRESVHAD